MAKIHPVQNVNSTTAEDPELQQLMTPSPLLGTKKSKAQRSSTDCPGLHKAGRGGAGTVAKRPCFSLVIARLAMELRVPPPHPHPFSVLVQWARAPRKRHNRITGDTDVSS